VGSIDDNQCECGLQSKEIELRKRLLESRVWMNCGVKVSQAYVGLLCMDQVDVRTQPWKFITNSKQATAIPFR
jgi:hypothetical protein